MNPYNYELYTRFRMFLTVKSVLQGTKMPLPVLHSYAGYSLYKLDPKNRINNFTLILFSMFAANAADLDFIPGILIGKAERFHHVATHSFGAAIIFGLIFAFVFKIWKKLDFKNTFRLSSLSYASHVFLDVVTHPAEKMPVFWPLFCKPLSFTKETFIPALQRSPETVKTGFAEFLRIVSGPTTYNRIMGEIIFVTAMTMILAIYGELQKHAADINREKEIPIPILSTGRFPAPVNIYQTRPGSIAAFSSSGQKNTSGSSYFQTLESK